MWTHEVLLLNMIINLVFNPLREFQRLTSCVVDIMSSGVIVKISK